MSQKGSQQGTRDAVAKKPTGTGQALLDLLATFETVEEEFVVPEDDLLPLDDGPEFRLDDDDSDKASR